MIKEIKYNGFTETPSDYECPDGDLAGVAGMVPEDNAMYPVMPPEDLFTLPDGYSVAFIHENTGYKHYIIVHDNKVYWIDEPQHGSTLDASDFTNSNMLKDMDANTIHNINAVGNTLVVLASDGMHYILWKGNTDGYLYLGTHMPELPLSFGLQGEMIRTDAFTIYFNGWTSDTDHLYDEFSDENKSYVSNQVLSKVNKFIAENSTDAGKFIFPFLVRYAYRLYDGSLTMHSAPVLMVCSSDITPVVMYDRISNGGSGDFSEALIRIVCMRHSLDYAVALYARINLLREWKDIVRSVDIFISKPIYTYDQNGQVQRFVRSRGINSFSICKHINQEASTKTYPLRYQYRTFNTLYAFTFNPDNPSVYTEGGLELPRRSTEQVKADIRACSQFYLLKSIKLDELTTTRTVIPIEEDYLQSLVNREAMSDDYDSHDILIPHYSFGYNSRLNIANIEKRLYDTYNTGALFCYTDGYVAHYKDSSPTTCDIKEAYEVYFYIKQDGRDIVVGGESFYLSNMARFLFLYYPNINAYKAVLYNWTTNVALEVPLEAHGFLNGAFYFDGWDNPTKVVSMPIESSDKAISVTNKIYTSEVNNPFFFPVLGINTVGTGYIIGISAAAKAMSQGQFGQFPLYAFTSEGIWALEVSNTGSYSARQPITRDVCINPDSITQIDSAVLFVTERGIMIISGSTSQCISDSINGHKSTFDITALPNIRSVCSEDTKDTLGYVNFEDYIKNCRMLYDYVHQRVIVYNPTQNYAYVYSLKSKQWGIIPSDIKASLNSYPEAIALRITSDGENDVNVISDYSQADNAISAVNGVIITRPLKLDMPDVLKTVDTVIQRGYFKKGHVKTILYGSRDLFNWHYVFSSSDHYLRAFRGTPYKYFRLSLICNLEESESITGCTVQFTPRYTNKPR